MKKSKQENSNKKRDTKSKQLPDKKTEAVDSSSTVRPQEQQLIDEGFSPESTEEEPIDELSLDNADSEGEELNEKSQQEDMFGEDLDTPLVREEDEEDGSADQ